MVKSMTGFGSSKTKVGAHEVNVEIRSLNSKFADVSVKLPISLSKYEINIKKQVSDQLLRGKVNVAIDIVSEDQSLTGIYNYDLLRVYYAELTKIADELNANKSELLKLALQSPGVTGATEKEWPEEILAKMMDCIAEAVDDCDEFRMTEGAELESKLNLYLAGIERALVSIKDLEEERILRLESKLRDGLKELENTGNFEADKNRFEQELIYYIEKFDINEEKVRLNKHIAYFKEVLLQNEPNGKKLGFISQEMGREINTIGSKANHAGLQRLVVQMKEELEKIKEQLLNIL